MFSLSRCPLPKSGLWLRFKEWYAESWDRNIWVNKPEPLDDLEPSPSWDGCFPKSPKICSYLSHFIIISRWITWACLNKAQASKLFICYEKTSLTYQRVFRYGNRWLYVNSKSWMCWTRKGNFRADKGEFIDMGIYSCDLRLNIWSIIPGTIPYMLLGWFCDGRSGSHNEW